MRKMAKHFGREVYCHRAFLRVEPLPGVPIQQALRRLRESERRATISWLTRGGPFWDDLRRHSGDVWLECRGEVVTESAVGEAAYRKLHSVECGLVSITPSDWNFSPVEVIWKREDEGLKNRNTRLENWRDATSLEKELTTTIPPVRSWDDLGSTSTHRFSNLTFANECFRPLEGVTFTKSSMERILELFSILDQLAGAFDEAGKRTPEGHRIYQDFFKGENALFSDSTDTEKSKFCNKLTFKHPSNPEKFLFCPWHGKERHKVLRLHFSWPIQFGEPVYVVYVGPKITKK